MSVGRSVQFRGVDNVLRAYENMAVGPWALFQGTQLLAKNDEKEIESGKALLNELLNTLNAEDNVATYTLCVYDDLKPGEKIKSGTKYDGSFNFKLNNNYADYQAQKIGSAQALQERISGLEKKIDAYFASPVENESEAEKIGSAGPWAMIGKLLENPDIQQGIATRVLGIIDGVSAMFAKPFVSPSVPARIGAVDEGDQDQMVMAINAFNFLCTADPDFGTHLSAIAKVAKENPEKYSQLIGMIKFL